MHVCTYTCMQSYSDSYTHKQANTHTNMHTHTLSPLHGHARTLTNTVTLCKLVRSPFASLPGGHMSAAVTQFHRHGDAHWQGTTFKNGSSNGRFSFSFLIFSLFVKAGEARWWYSKKVDILCTYKEVTQSRKTAWLKQNKKSVSGPVISHHLPHDS